MDFTKILGIGTDINMFLEVMKILVEKDEKKGINLKELGDVRREIVQAVVTIQSKEKKQVLTGYFKKIAEDNNLDEAKVKNQYYKIKMDDEVYKEFMKNLKFDLKPETIVYLIEGMNEIAGKKDDKNINDMKSGAKSIKDMQNLLDELLNKDNK